MLNRTRAVLIVSTLLVVFIPLGQTQRLAWTVVVELHEGESLEGFANRHDASILDSTGDSYLVSAPPVRVYEMASDSGLRHMEPEFAIGVSEWAIPAADSTGLLNPDTVALLNNLEMVQSGGAYIRKSLIKQPALDLIGCEDEHYGFASGRGVRVAIIDTGIDALHPALAGRVLPGFNFVENSDNTQDALPPLGSPAVSMVALLNPSTVALLNPDTVALLNDPRTRYFGHGTLVSGLIRTVAPDALLVPLKAFDDSGHASSFTVAKAIRYAADQNVDVINMSFDFDHPSMIIRDALDYAASRNVVLVSSAGNNDTVANVYPAIHPEVIAVASTDKSDRKARFSNYGPAVAVAAPGDSLVSTYPGDRYAAIAGTSFSAALVSGEAALIRSSGVFPRSEVRDRIVRSAKRIGEKNPGIQLGRGRIRISEAVGEKDER